MDKENFRAVVGYEPYRGTAKPTGDIAPTQSEGEEKKTCGGDKNGGESVLGRQNGDEKMGQHRQNQRAKLKKACLDRGKRAADQGL